MSIESLFGPQKEPKPPTQTETPKPPTTPAPPAISTLFQSSPPQSSLPVAQPIPPVIQSPATAFNPPPPPAPAQSAQNLFSMAEAPKPAAPIVNPLTAQGMGQFGGTIDNNKKVKVPEFPTEYDLSPEAPSELRYFTIFGGKNSSKTTLALSFPGKIAVLSFDHKTVPSWITMFNADPRIVIYDAIRYIDYSSPEATLVSSEITFRYINAILDKIKAVKEDDRPDWIVIDGLEEYTKISEDVMRHRNGLGWTQGVEWQYWKSRKLYVKQLFLRVASIVKRGVIFCTKYEFEDVVVGGITKDKKKVPIWIDIVRDQTDIQIETDTTEDRQTGEIRFWAHITGSKYIEYPKGVKVDITAAPGKVDAWSKLYKESQ